MRMFPLLIGTLGLSLAEGILSVTTTLPVHAQDAPESVLQQSSLYYRLRKMTLREKAEDASEKEVETFVTKIYPRQKLPLFEAADVDRALQMRMGEICRPEDPQRSPISQGSCVDYMNEIDQLVKENARLRQFARDLQIAAASFEAGMGDAATQRTDVFSKLPSITHLWQSDTDSALSPVVESKVRGALYPEAMDGDFSALYTVLMGLRGGDMMGDPNAKEDREKFVAAVWRYRHGVKNVMREGGSGGGQECDENRNGLGNGTELQFLSARFCSVEEKLQNILGSMAGVPYDPPLKPGEIVLFPIKNLDGGTGGDIGVSVWATNEDVGLLWNMHLDPVLPSLDCSPSHSFTQPLPTCSGEAILGGEYPPEPEEPAEGTGLCSHPFAKRGYLCRPKETVACAAGEGSTALPQDIHLFGCNTPNMEAPSRWTESGPNICGEGGWRAKTQGYIPVTDDHGTVVADNPDTPARDNQGENALKPDWCSNCFVDTVCGGCTDTTIEAETLAKGEDGRIEICLNPAVPAMSTYLLIREMVHAQQTCSSPPGEDTIIAAIRNDGEGCCAYEYPAALAQCNAMAEDGMLEGVAVGGGNPIDIDIETCAGMVANRRCSGDGTFGESCVNLPGSPDPARTAQIWQAVEANVAEKSATLGIGQSCPEAVVEKLDARVQKQKNSLPQVCTPLCETKYESTIGNNACMVGQCLEESLERHRLIPGRMALGTQDESFPWDANAPNDPNNGAFMSTTSQESPPLPPYRPALLARQMDNMLCQINGLPTRTPPILCGFDPLRRLRVPTKNFLPFAQSLLDQPEEQASIHSFIEDTAAGVGTRIGTEVYRQYLIPALGSFEALMRSASDLLQNMEDTEFPAEMCRRNANNVL